MRKTFIAVACLCAVSVLIGCKSKESEYKKAYEAAKAEEMANQSAVAEPEEAEEVVVAPVVTTVTTAPAEESVRSERLNAVDGGSLKTYNVVCGSFKVQDNANNLKSSLQKQGYQAQVAQNPETGMYRVVATSSDDKATAISSRNTLRAYYPDAWILYRTY